MTDDPYLLNSYLKKNYQNKYLWYFYFIFYKFWLSYYIKYINIIVLWTILIIKIGFFNKFIHIISKIWK